MKSLTKTRLLAIFITSLIFIFSCGEKKESTDGKDTKVLTERIQYDVLIKTPDQDFDWWVQNIEGSKRESFVKTFLDLASSGKVKTYDYLNLPLSKHQIDSILVRYDTITNIDPRTNVATRVPVKEELNIQQITKVRFLEEWNFDEKKLNFDKKVVGLMLMKENYGDSTELRGYSPLFWIYFDDKYPAKMK